MANSPSEKRCCISDGSSIWQRQKSTSGLNFCSTFSTCPVKTVWLRTLGIEFALKINISNNKGIKDKQHNERIDGDLKNCLRVLHFR